AVITFLARNVVKAHHPVTRFKLRHAQARSGDRACELVAENLWRLDVTLENFLNVGATDAACGNFDEDFARANFRDRHFFDADYALFAIDTSAHGFGNRSKNPQIEASC